MSVLNLNFKKIAQDWFGGSDCYRMTYLLYILGGLWMVELKYIEKNKNVFVLFFLLRYLAVIAASLAFFSFVYDAYIWWHNIEKLTYSLGVSIYYTVMIVRFIILANRKSELEVILDTINNNFFLEDVGKSTRDLLILKSGEQLFKLVTCFCYFLMVSGVSAKIISHIIEEKFLIIPFPYVDKIESPSYEIMFVFESIIFIHFLVLWICHEMVIFGVLIRVLQHFIILGENISSIGDVFATKTKTFEKRNDSVLKKWKQDRAFELIKKNVIHHQEIIKVLIKTNSILQESFFIQIFGGGLLLVDLFFHVTTQTSGFVLKILSQTIYSLGALLDIAFLCYCGSTIEVKSHEAATALYSIPWLEMGVKNRKTLRFFQMALLKYPIIKGGIVLSVNLSMLLKFLNYIYSFLAFMQNTIRRNG